VCVNVCVANEFTLLPLYFHGIFLCVCICVFVCLGVVLWLNSFRNCGVKIQTGEQVSQKLIYLIFIYIFRL